MNPEGFAFCQMQGGTVQVLELLPSIPPAPGSTPFVPLTNFGALGTADDSATWQAGINGVKGTGFILWVPPGTTTIGHTVELASDLTIWVAPGVTIVGDVSGGPIFHHDQSGTGIASTTVASFFDRGGNSITVTSAASIAVGSWLLIQQVVGTLGGFYQVMNISGTTLTLDRAISWAFAPGDPVTVYAGNPTLQDFVLQGFSTGAGPGFAFTGLCTEYIQVNGSYNCAVRNVSAFTEIPPGSATFGISWEHGFNDEFSNMSFIGSQGGIVTCAYLLVAEDTAHVRNLVAISDDGSMSDGFQLNDCILCEFEGLNAQGVVNGINLLTDSSSPNVGSQQCSFVNCSAVGCGNFGLNLGDGVSVIDQCTFTNFKLLGNVNRGLFLSKATACKFANFVMQGNTRGVECQPGSVNNKFVNFHIAGTASGVGNFDVLIGAGAPSNQFVSLDIEGTVATHIEVNDATRFDGVTGTIDGTGFVFSAGNSVCSDVNLAMSTAGDIGISVPAGSTAIVRLVNVIVTGTGDGLAMAAGTVYVDTESSFAGASTPFAWTGGTLNFAKQTGSASLAAGGGQVTVDTGISITAASVIMVSRRTQAGTITATAQYEAPSASRVLGGPGTGAMTIQASTSAGAVATTDASVVDWAIF